MNVTVTPKQSHELWAPEREEEARHAWRLFWASVRADIRAHVPVGLHPTPEFVHDLVLVEAAGDPARARARLSKWFAWPSACADRVAYLLAHPEEMPGEYFDRVADYFGLPAERPYERWETFEESLQREMQRPRLSLLEWGRQEIVRRRGGSINAEA